LIKIIIKEENFKWHLEAVASELFIYTTYKYTLKCTYFLLHSNPRHLKAGFCNAVDGEICGELFKCPSER